MVERDAHGSDGGRTSRPAPWAAPAAAVLEALESRESGLSRGEAAARLQAHGPNVLPQAKPAGLAAIVLHQFRSPFIYILMAAAAVSLLLGHSADAVFIGIVLALNATVGAAQEWGAERSAQALQSLVSLRAFVRREGENVEVPADSLVPGDIVLIESGAKVPADIRLITTNDLSCEEALLTGESLAVGKDPALVLDPEAALGDRRNMAFAGTLVARGRAAGVVTATAGETQIGAIASAVLGGRAVKPPLLLRMAAFANKVALAIAAVVALLGGLLLIRGTPWGEVFMVATALAVAAIPEGLPIALTVALSISMRRMSRRNVIVRRLVAVEALGSCTFVASDKTGTLTLNQMTVRRLGIAGGEPWEVTGGGQDFEGGVVYPPGIPPDAAAALAGRLALAVGLCNEAVLARSERGWVGHGDAVDVALLVLAHKAGLGQVGALGAHEPVARIPFESERKFAATLHRHGGQAVAHVKGAPERVMAMCDRMATLDGDVPLSRSEIERLMEALANQGYRVLAAASGPPAGEDGTFSEGHLRGLTFLGLVGLMDPPRPESRGAVEACRRAGIEVAMVTGDHPGTAFAISRELGLVRERERVATGPELRRAQESGPAAFDAVTARTRVFARVEPDQKLDIVQSLQRQGHYVAVTGDGANDAPALRAAHVGVAMGKAGTDVARESSDIILTDDHFASIVAGVEEGRVAYGNVRKVTFFLISESFSYLLLFVVALVTGMPAPLVAVQLLWLNLVTNGIQDVALAFEPAEGGELARPPRRPSEPLFDRLMIERTLVAGTWMGLVTFAYYAWALGGGQAVEAVQNQVLLLLVLFGNFHVGNCRSETASILYLNPLRNPLLLAGTAAAQLLHISAMHVPPLAGVLRLAPVTTGEWLRLVAVASTILAVEELRKALRRRAS